MTKDAYYSQYFLSQDKQLAILIDPDKHNATQIEKIAKKIENSNANLIFLGSSLHANTYDNAIVLLKRHTQKPIILFPGNSLQITNKADAILNLSLISGRNPEFLIGEHVRSAMLLKTSKLEIIPTAYILIDGGNKSSVAYMSNTQVIPSTKTDIALATALAGTFLGMKCVYLEAGSGALQSVPNKMIQTIAKEINVPIICGGGIKTQKEVQEKFDAGAQIVVVGTAFEENINWL